MQWLHLVGLLNVRTRNWWIFCFWIADTELWTLGWSYNAKKGNVKFIRDWIWNILTIELSLRLLFELDKLCCRLSSISPSSLSIEYPCIICCCCWCNCCWECTKGFVLYVCWFCILLEDELVDDWFCVFCWDGWDNEFDDGW